MGRTLSDLANVARAAGLPVTEIGGWQTRGRGGAGGRQTSGYQDGRPSAVMCHHTASNTKPENDVAYMTFNAPYAPIANLGLDRTGRVWVMAGWATNTNGSGVALPGIPTNSANAVSIGIEAFNDGVGEPWPQVQQDAYVTLVAALCKAYSIPHTNVHAHFEYAPGRKIDPFGPAKWGPQKWNMPVFRTDVQTKMTGGPTTPPPTKPPPTGGDVVDVAPAMYWVRPGDSAWSATARLFGSGAGWADRFTADQFNRHSYYTPVKGTRGKCTNVLSGEGAYAILDRMGFDRSRLDDFYNWNGGPDRTLHPGNAVFMGW